MMEKNNAQFNDLPTKRDQVTQSPWEMQYAKQGMGCTKHTHEHTT